MSKHNPFALYDCLGQEKATREIRAAADALVAVIEKHKSLGAEDTASREAILDYVVQR